VNAVAWFAFGVVVGMLGALPLGWFALQAIEQRVAARSGDVVPPPRRRRSQPAADTQDQIELDDDSINALAGELERAAALQGVNLSPLEASKQAREMFIASGIL
jgi:hypothetical protein